MELAQGQTRGSMLQQHTNKTLTTGPFDNTYEADEVSSEVEAGVVVALRRLQPYLGHRSVIVIFKLLRQLRGGVNQLLLCLKNIKSIKPFLIFHQVTINIIHHMDNINNEHQSHIRYT
jgi:hypothetical protein